MKLTKYYGKELILDLHNCSPAPFSRNSIKNYFKEVCSLINMQRETLYFWDYKNYPEEYKKAPIHLKGTSAIQFIKTSNITIHTLDLMKRVYLNLFSCKDFNEKHVIEFTEKWFDGMTVSKKIIWRS